MSAEDRRQLAEQVKVDQVWADSDPRMAGRKLRVTEVHQGSEGIEPYAVLVVVANARNVSQDNLGRTRRVKLRRLVGSATARGYKLDSSPDVMTQTLIDTINEYVGDDS